LICRLAGYEYHKSQYTGNDWPDDQTKVGAERREQEEPENRKQKNGWQKNGDESAPIFIFLPGIFLLTWP